MKKKIIISSSLGVFIILILSIFLLKDCIFPHTTNSLSFWSFDTVVTIKIYDEKDGLKHLEHIENEYKKISNACDDYKGELYELNENREIDASSYLVDVINKSIELKEETNGYFNPLIGRLTHLYKEKTKENKLEDITNEIIEDELSIMNNSSIVINENHIRINGDANIDLGAITKGYATEFAKNYLIDKGVKKYLINSGESSIYIGNKTHRVGLLKPLDSRNDYYKKINLKNIGISTSAISYQKFHIISPITGIQESYYKSISVISDNNLNNDVYSTALFSMEENKLIDFAQNHNLEIYAYKEENNIIHVEKV